MFLTIVGLLLFVLLLVGLHGCNGGSSKPAPPPTTAVVSTTTTSVPTVIHVVPSTPRTLPPTE